MVSVDSSSSRNGRKNSRLEPFIYCLSLIGRSAGVSSTSWQYSAESSLFPGMCEVFRCVWCQRSVRLRCSCDVVPSFVWGTQRAVFCVRQSLLGFMRLSFWLMLELSVPKQWKRLPFYTSIHFSNASGRTSDWGWKLPLCCDGVVLRLAVFSTCSSQYKQPWRVVVTVYLIGRRPGVWFRHDSGG